MTSTGSFDRGIVHVLISHLDSDDAGEAEEAQAELIGLGPVIAPDVLAALPTLGTFGKLCAMDVVDAWHYTDAGPALVPLLRDEASTVREWAAWLLGLLGHRAAVPELSALDVRLRDEGVPPGWTEPCAVRWALTALHAREPVVPELATRTRERRSTGDVWPADGIHDLLVVLAEAHQVVLGFQVWRDDGDRLVWQREFSVGWEYDRSAHWETNVGVAHRAADLEASSLPEDRSNLVVTIEWIDASDEAVGSTAVR